MAEHAVGTAPGAPPAGWCADPVYTGVGRAWSVLACLVAGGVLAVAALGVFLVVTTPPAPLYDLPAQAGFGALFVILGAAVLVCALIDALVLVALRVRAATAGQTDRARP